MDVYPISATPNVGLCDGLDALIENVATPRFNEQLLRVAQSIVGSTHIAAFSITPEGPPQIVLTADRGPASLAYSASNVFVNRFWTQDPVNRMDFTNDDLERGVVVKVPVNEFQRIPYRRDCYSVNGWSSGGIKLIERLTLLRQHHGRIIRIDFYRSRDGGAYRARDVKKASVCAELLLALVARHALGTMAPPMINSGPTLEKLVRRIAPDLSQREVQVCAGITLGMSSEAIASSLGIGINTVLTYRKRAYARLRISSHNELLRMVFCAATAVGLDVEPQQPWQMSAVDAEPLWRN
jgi:DNA-binding CsgD family transcriptional regulator